VNAPHYDVILLNYDCFRKGSQVWMTTFATYMLPRERSVEMVTQGWKKWFSQTQLYEKQELITYYILATIQGVFWEWVKPSKYAVVTMAK